MASSSGRHAPDIANWVSTTFASLPKIAQVDGEPTLGKRYFVDLAANHPVVGSNTFGLERRGWEGLCIEPNPEYVAMLRKQRKCKLASVVIDRDEREVQFELAGAMGGIMDQRFDNRASGLAVKGRVRPAVQTIRTQPFQQVLRNASAPQIIDFLSLDVEGAESAVLSEAFPFDEFVFLVLAIERPPPDLNSRLFRHGYLFAKAISSTDAFYVHASHPRAASVSANASFMQMPAKCRNGQGIDLVGRETIKGVRCPSVFGCCTFEGFPQATTRYMQSSQMAKPLQSSRFRSSVPRKGGKLVSKAPARANAKNMLQEDLGILGRVGHWLGDVLATGFRWFRSSGAKSS